MKDRIKEVMTKYYRRYGLCPRCVIQLEKYGSCVSPEYHFCPELNKRRKQND